MVLSPLPNFFVVWEVSPAVTLVDDMTKDLMSKGCGGRWSMRYASREAGVDVVEATVIVVVGIRLLTALFR